MLIFQSAVFWLTLFFVRIEAINDTATIRAPNYPTAVETDSNTTAPLERVPISEPATGRTIEEKATTRATVAERVLSCTLFTRQNTHVKDLDQVTHKSFSVQNSASSVQNSPIVNLHSELSPGKIASEQDRLATTVETPNKETVIKSAQVVRSNNRGPSRNTSDTNEETTETDDLACVLFKRAPVTSFSDYAASCSAESDHRLCGCTSICVLLNNCCGDSELIQSTVQIPSPSAYEPVSCRQNVSNSWSYSSPSLLVDSCSKDWADDQVFDRCTIPREDDIRSYIPCYSRSAGLSYLNIHCAQCNKIMDCLDWTITFQSKYPFQFQYINTYSKMTGTLLRSKEGGLVLSAAPGTEPNHCVPDVIDRCREPLKTGLESTLCRSYYSPVVVGGKLYRNIHCFMCFINSDINPNTIDIIHRVRRNTMSVLLQIGSSQVKKISSLSPACLICLSLKPSSKIFHS